MDKELRALRRRIERTARNARGYRRYDERLRVEIVEYVLRREDDGYSQAAVARELGITQRTVWGWVRQLQGDVLRPVELVDDEVQHEASSARTLVLRGGLRVEGLSLDDVLALVRELS